jgi:hypothetical protein
LEIAPNKVGVLFGLAIRVRRRFFRARPLGIIFQPMPYAFSRVIVVYTTPDDGSFARLFCRYAGVLGIETGTGYDPCIHSFTLAPREAPAGFDWRWAEVEPLVFVPRASAFPLLSPSDRIQPNSRAHR